MTACVFVCLLFRDVIDDDRVTITFSENSFEPPPISPFSNDVQAFQIIANSALQASNFSEFPFIYSEYSGVRECKIAEYSFILFQVFPDGHIAPGTLIANTDTKHYLHLTEKVYR